MNELPVKVEGIGALGKGVAVFVGIIAGGVGLFGLLIISLLVALLFSMYRKEQPKKAAEGVRYVALGAVPTFLALNLMMIAIRFL